MRIDAHLIKQQRQLRGWTQQHLSDVTGVSLRTIQRVESQGQGSHETISALASVFEIDRQTLLITEPMEPAQSNGLGWLVAVSLVVGASLGATLTYLLLQ